MAKNWNLFIPAKNFEYRIKIESIQVNDEYGTKKSLKFQLEGSFLVAVFDIITLKNTKVSIDETTVKIERTHDKWNVLGGNLLDFKNDVVA